MVLKEGGELLSIPVLGNSHVIGAVFTGLCAVQAAILLQHVPRCSEREFNAGNFLIQKTNRVFSAIPIDQAHEQNNVCIKNDGEAIGLTDNPSALRLWMVAGPEVVALIEDFEDAHQLMRIRDDVVHHDQTASVQNAFRKDVCSLVNVMEELGNPFEEENED